MAKPYSCTMSCCKNAQHHTSHLVLEIDQLKRERDELRRMHLAYLDGSEVARLTTENQQLQDALEVLQDELNTRIDEIKTLRERNRYLRRVLANIIGGVTYDLQ